jgi:hypothetical protein
VTIDARVLLQKMAKNLKFSKLSAGNRVEVLFDSFCVFKVKSRKSFFVKLRFLPTLGDLFLKIKSESIDFQA